MSTIRPFSSPEREPLGKLRGRAVERQCRRCARSLRPAVIPPQVGQLLPDQPAQPAHQRRLVLTRELRKLPHHLHQHLLNHVRHLDTLAQPRAQPGAHNHPQIIPVKRAQLTQGFKLTRARLRQQLNRAFGHPLRLSWQGYRAGLANHVPIPIGVN